MSAVKYFLSIKDKHLQIIVNVKLRAVLNFLLIFFTKEIAVCAI